MLAMTNTTLFEVDVSSTPCPTPIRPGMVRVAQGRQVTVIALADHSVLVLKPGGLQVVLARLSEPIESLLILREEPPACLVGTEGAHLELVTENGTRHIDAFDRLPMRNTWFTPWGGPPAVRSLAGTAEGDIYADIHVGSIMHSGDYGQTWSAVTPELNQDVHQVAVCPAVPENVYANTAKGFYLSTDKGRHWLHRARDLSQRYGRAVAVAPYDPKLVMASVSDGPHGEDVHAQLYVSDDAGLSWHRAGGAFPESTRQNINTYHIVFSQDGNAWAAVGHRLFVGEQEGRKWCEFFAAEEDILMLTTTACSCIESQSPQTAATAG